MVAGLMDMSTRGVLYKRTYLRGSDKALLMEAIDETLEMTCDMSEEGFNRLIEAMSFIKSKLKDKKSTALNIKISKSIANTIMFWSIDTFRHHKEDECKRVCQWLTNLWNRKWSILEIINH